MPTRWVTQIDMSSGELDPRALGRVDLERRPSALGRARNVVLEKTGATRVRDGWRWVADVPGNVITQLCSWARGDADYLISAAADTSVSLFDASAQLVETLQGEEEGYVLSVMHRNQTGSGSESPAQGQESKHVYLDGAGGHTEQFGLVSPPLAAAIKPGWTATAAHMASVVATSAPLPVDPFRLDTETFEDQDAKVTEWGAGGVITHQFWSNQNLLLALISWEGDATVESVTLEPNGINIAAVQLVSQGDGHRGVAIWGMFNFTPQSGEQVVKVKLSAAASGSVWLASFVSAARLPVARDVATASSVGSLLQTELTVPAGGFGETSVGLIDTAPDSQALLFFHEDVQPHWLHRTEEAGWLFEPYPIADYPYHSFQAEGVTLDPSATSGSITLTTSEAHWLPNHVGSIVRYGSTKKKIEVTAYTSPTVVAATVLENLSTHAADADWDEQAWSAGRGWPVSGCWHQGRLVIGGARDLRNGLWASQPVAAGGGAVSFDIGIAGDGDAIAAVLRADDSVNIQYVRSQGPLLILASGTEWIVQQQPMTPTSISFDLQASQGAARVKPADLDGAILYLRSPRGGTASQGEQPAVHFAWDELSQRYRALDIGVLGQHLLRNPVDMAGSRGTTSDANNRLYLANADGTVAVLHLPSVERPGITLVESDVQPYSLAVASGRLYGAALFNGAHRIFVLDPDSHLDASQAFDFEGFFLNEDLGPFPCLADQVALVKGWTEENGWQEQVVTVSSDGFFNLDVEEEGQIPVEKGEIGIPYEWIIQPLPLEAGPATVGSLKSPVEMRLQVQDAIGVEIGDADGRSAAALDDGSAPGDLTTDPATLYSGHLRQHLNGWSEDAIVEVGGTRPWGARVLSIAVKVEF